MEMVLECACGARVRAPGAVPGRTGRCPRCGATLHVPEADPAPTGIAAPAGYVLQPDAGGAATRETAPRARKKRAPKAVEARFHESLGYPFREASGLALLGIFPPLCVVTSVFSFGLREFVFSGNEVMTMGALTMVFPALILLMLILGTGLRYLEQVLESSTRGEDRPPRWSRSNVFEILTCLGRWLGALAFGLAIGVALAWVYQAQTADFPEAARRGYVELITAVLFGLGGLFWPMSILAVTLHQSVRAANPILVLAAIVRSGRGYLGISLLFGLACAVTATWAALLYHIPNILATVVGVYLFWVFFWYEGMVLMRRLGLFYQKRARAVGWFSHL